MKNFHKLIQPINGKLIKQGKIEIEHKYEDRAILEETKKEREEKLNSK